MSTDLSHEPVTTPAADTAPPRRAEDHIAWVADLVRTTRPMPLSANVSVPRDEVLGALEAALASLPAELRAARWLLKEREEFLAAARVEADELVAAARAQAEQMVRRTEVVRRSELHARRIRAEAEAESRRWRRETEDYCEQRLARFEDTLERVAQAVRTGRERLHEVPREVVEPVDGAEDDTIDLTDERPRGLFDQDRSDADRS